MNNIDLAIKELSSYKQIQIAIKKIELEIEEINTRLYFSKAIDYTKQPVDGGKIDSDSVTFLINKKNILEMEKTREENKLKLIDKILNQLNYDEKVILELFYIDRKDNHVEKAKNTLYCSRSAVYHKKNQAIKNYAKYRFGQILDKSWTNIGQKDENQ